jgi:hypothetical protein
LGAKQKKEKNMKRKLYYVAGKEEDWGAKHYWKRFFGRELSPEEQEKYGIKVECHCHYPCSGQLGGQGRYRFTLYSLESEQDVVEVNLDSPTTTGFEGYDVALNDPWDSSPRKHWEERLSEKSVIRFEQELPEPCNQCNMRYKFVCKCDYDI